MPATYSFAGGTLSIVLDQASESIALQAVPGQYQIVGSDPALDGGGLAGVVSLAGNNATVTNPTAVTRITITDTSSDTSVVFNDSGSNAFTAEIDVVLDEIGSSSVSFFGSTAINPTVAGTTVEISAGDIVFDSSSLLVVSGTGTNLSLTDTGTNLTLPSTQHVSGNLAVTANGNIDQHFSFTAESEITAASATFRVDDPFFANIDLSGANRVPGAVSFAEATPGTIFNLRWRNLSSTATAPDVSALPGLADYTLSLDNTAAALGTIAVTGTLSVTAFGDITQLPGTTLSSPFYGTFTVLGNSSITLNNPGNAIASVSFFSDHSTRAVSLVNSVTLDLFESRLGRASLSVTTQGDIFQSVFAAVTQLPSAGPVTLAVPNGSTITLDLDNEFTGHLTVAPGAVAVNIRNLSPTAAFADYTFPDTVTDLTLTHEAAPVVLGNLGTTALPNLGLLTVTGQGIFQAPGTTVVVPVATFNSAATVGPSGVLPPSTDILLTAAGNDFDTVAVSTFAYGDVTLVDADDLDLGLIQGGTGRLTVRAGDDITQSAALISLGGWVSVTSTGGNITLTDAGNDILGTLSLAVSGSNDIDVLGGALHLGNVTSGTGSLSITAAGAFPGSTLTQAPGTRITAGGPSSFSAAGIDTRLDNPGNSFAGPIAIPQGANVFLRTTGAVQLGDWRATRATIQAGGAVTQVPGTSLLRVEVPPPGQTGDINVHVEAGTFPVTLTNAGNDFSLFSATTTGNVAVRDKSGITLDDLRLGAGTLDIEVAEFLLQIGKIIQEVPLGGTAGGLTFRGTNPGTQITLGRGNDLDRPLNEFRGPVTILNGGAVDVDNRFDLTITDASTMTGAVSLRAGRTLTLPNAALSLQSLEAAGSRVIVRQNISAFGGGGIVFSGTTDLQGGPRTLTSNAFISFDGDVSIAGNLTLNTPEVEIASGTLNLGTFNLTTSPGASLSIGDFGGPSDARVVGSNSTINLGLNGTLSVNVDGVLQVGTGSGAETLTVNNPGGDIFLGGRLAVGFGATNDKLVKLGAGTVDLFGGRLTGSALASNTASPVIEAPVGSVVNKFGNALDGNFEPINVFLAGTDVVQAAYTPTAVTTQSGGTPSATGTVTGFLPDGEQYTVTSSLGGAAGLVVIERNSFDAGPVIDVVVRNNSATSTLTISTSPDGNGDGITSVGSIAVNGPGGVTITAPTADIVGDILVQGELRAFTARDIRGSFDFPAIIRPGGTAASSTTVTARNVDRALFDLPGNLTALTVANSGGLTQYVANKFGTLRATGIPAEGLVADFRSDLATRTNTLGVNVTRVEIAGELSGTWDVFGNVGTVIAQTTRGWNLGANLDEEESGAGFRNPDGLRDVASLTPGRVTNTDLTATGRINTLTATDWDGGQLRAGAFNALTIRADLPTGTVGNLFADVLAIGNAGGATKLAINRMSVGGTFGTPGVALRDLIVARNGNIGTLTVGRDLDGEVHAWTTPDVATGKIKTLTTGRLGIHLGAFTTGAPTIDARAVGRLAVVGNVAADLPGDVANTNVRLRGHDGTARRVALSSFSATGDVTFSRIDSADGSVGFVTIGRETDRLTVTLLDPQFGSLGPVTVGEFGSSDLIARTISRFESKGAARIEDSPALVGNTFISSITAFDDTAATSGIGALRVAGTLGFVGVSAPAGITSISIGREMNLSSILADSARPGTDVTGRVGSLTAGVIGQNDVIVESIGNIAANGYATPESGFQSRVVGTIAGPTFGDPGLNVVAKVAGVASGVGIGAVSAEGTIEESTFAAPKGITSLSAGNLLSELIILADFVPDGSPAKPTFGKVGSLAASGFFDVIVRADTIGTVTSTVSNRFGNNGYMWSTELTARDATAANGIASVTAAGDGFDLDVRSPARVGGITFASDLNSSTVAAGYGPTGSLTAFRVGELSSSTMVSRQVGTFAVTGGPGFAVGGLSLSWVNVFGNTAGVGLGTFTAKGTLDHTVIDVTDGDVTSFTAARMRDSTLQVGARYTKGNTVDAAVTFDAPTRRIGTLRLIAPFSGFGTEYEDASAAFRDSYIAAANLGTVSIAGVATVAPDTELQGVVHSPSGSPGTVTVAGVTVPTGTTIQAKFKKAAN